MTKLLLLTLLLLSVGFVQAHDLKAKASRNHLNASGEREGFWVVSRDNDPIVDDQELKYKEGSYKNGRKEGVWITYYEDGVTPRLIGEYADNRPAGTYFRFDRKGELVQASSVPKRISIKQSVQSSNSVYSCKMMFNQREMIAGQVFFTHRLFKKDLSFQFWVGESLEQVKSETKLVDYSWLNANYTKVLMTYTAIRTPKKMRLEPSLATSVSPVKDKKQNLNTKGLAYYHPPMLKDPRVSKGMTFMPNGLNKVYTESAEIWMDGHFMNGQLNTGKVFVYDHDGVLLKVRLYKNGIYESDGVL
ncbi:MAG: hypothetical protein A3D31_19005 [Candidatus Fluviicola riflensis]|nr:MAG: hypothetical protein CHH17_05725 [Candidatus Fluviicola riflensis]OGS75877.1 MAG: hypothetical protein A3D31_19005 [Candidatus Fluviicola riflensis]OGS83557.1 MAG: hypothetical protein A2724_19020 [Fluviicola sp. RIFCSPHIGHO2_01_FULL_43_53]OGS85696.1 MAG: hypothetical protein A3E30_18550 [Fluviicola sp. RIFCSPHIGHO2_12_FULL_43_24]